MTYFERCQFCGCHPRVWENGGGVWAECPQYVRGDYSHIVDAIDHHECARKWNEMQTQTPDEILDALHREFKGVTRV